MPHFEFNVKTADGLNLQGRCREPEAKIKAVVCLVHGLGEHSGRYEHVADAFNRKGYAVFTFDLRGHGRSEGPRGHAPNYAALMADISKVLNTAKQHHPDLPTFLYGHSLGGNLVLHYALRQQPKLSGIIASGPMLRMSSPPPAWKTAMLRLLHALHIDCSIPSGLDDTALSRDINVVHTYRNDPLTHNRITPRLAVDMIRNGEWNLQHAAELPCPLLLMHGDADRITSPEATRAFAEKAGTACTLKIWDGLFHELHNEPEQNEMLDYVLAWLAAVTAENDASNSR